MIIWNLWLTYCYFGDISFLSYLHVTYLLSSQLMGPNLQPGPSDSNALPRSLELDRSHTCYGQCLKFASDIFSQHLTSTNRGQDPSFEKTVSMNVWLDSSSPRFGVNMPKIIWNHHPVVLVTLFPKVRNYLVSFTRCSVFVFFATRD